MCGIVGRVEYRQKIDGALLCAQRDSMTHRGPDSEGIWVSDDSRVGLGHRRLAIIDLTPGGHQPMLDRDTGCIITFNGEIYNYRDLRNELVALGRTFRTASDTEVILAAYAQWGALCTERLEGMFAFAIYDRSNDRLFLARDRTGEKPLYYAIDPSYFAFASELKALLVDPRLKRHLRTDSLNEYFAYGYVPGKDTMFDGVKRLEPGCTLEVSLSNQQIKQRRYWLLPEFDSSANDQAQDTILEEVELALRIAVRRQLVADVPIGVLLSGGLDSSIVTALAASESRVRLKTFTARFPGQTRFDEGPFAKLVASHLGTEHVELDIPPASADLLISLVQQFDDPIADSSLIPTYLVSRAVRQHATVALGGDGGDELFAGYHRYSSYLMQQRWRRLTPKWTRDALAWVYGRWSTEPRRGRGFAEALAGDIGTSIANAGRMFFPNERRLISPALRSLSEERLQRPEVRRGSSFKERIGAIQRGTAVDFTSYLVDDVLTKVDRASMLTSLEVRAPMLDVRVVQVAMNRVPDSLKASPTERKIALRSIGAKLLPPALDLRRKQGFSVPLDAWMRTAWKPLVEQACARPSTPLVDSAALRRYRDLLIQGRHVGTQLFALLSLRMWEEEFKISEIL
ncbi:MAG: asparagine synthase (glutamine-hydrolyzing) [Gemmatimonadaceae bacterium]|nr:asparagine synthase (glutamine-hydrolyzing) [Gemmatimonadaceae bacterium]